MDRSGLQVVGTHVPFDPSDEVAVTQSVHADKDPRTSQLILNQYQRGPLVGKGQHGEVFRCSDLSKGGALVAMKVVSRKNARQEKLQKLRRRNIPASGNHVPLTDNLGSTEYKIKREIALMKRCRHPHVVRLLEVIDDKLYKKIYMIMEYLGGGEIKWRDSDNNPILKVDQTRRICRDVILGLEYLHAQGIIHRDIKPANLMWTWDRRTVKITDFGVAHISAAQRLRGAGDASKPEDPDDALFLDDSDLAKTAGTPAFLAPEVVYDFGNSSDVPGSASPDAGGSSATVHASGSRRPPITKAIDVWALGVTLYSLLFGRTPFRGEGHSEFSLYQAICTQDWDVRETMGVDQIPTGGRHPVIKGKSKDYKRSGAIVVALLDRFLQKDAKKRITLDEVKVRI
ncbi:kinase-like protein [Dentipellis sp. KUC8613]|nr:kinase-like protein [Dentipellis sp. KUC8613]